MVLAKTKRLKREDWLDGALKILCAKGMDGVKIVPLAEQLGVTSGSFYWHFKNRKELYEALLFYWEKEMTDAPIETARSFKGSPKKRIWFLMVQVMRSGMARCDLAFWQWAQHDATAQKVFKRVLDKRFTFAAWMFEQAGFSKAEAESRGRMMVVYMMGESTLIPGSLSRRKNNLKKQHEILTNL